jgi:hypothetical protein
MQYEGRIRDHVYTNGARRDSLLYAVISGDEPSELGGSRLRRPEADRS